MNVNVHSIHFDADRKLIAFIEEKLAKLEQFHDSILGGEVFLRLENDRERRENKQVELRLNVPGVVLLAKRQAKTFEEAVIAVVEALRNQVLRNKPAMRKAV